MVSIKEKLEKRDILSLFQKGCKNNLYVGMEYERLPIFSQSCMAVGYDEGICEFLRQFAKDENWDYITDDYNIIGLKQNHDTVTLEPGCQIELSIKPEKTIFELEQKIKSLSQKINSALNKKGILLLNYGVSPLTTNKYIDLIPKRRYHIMAKYLWGILSDVMMRETAGIQGCFDFYSEEDAVRKFKIANKLTPFLTAMFANSPIRGGVDTGYKSFRALSWLNTDNERCGFACDLDKDFSFENYVDKVLNSPVIFLNKEDRNIPVKGKINFKQYMNKGFERYEATLDDFKLHANLYFPEVRLRNFIEIRNQDCNDMPFAILAIYKGILYNNFAMAEIDELLKPYSNEDFEELRYSVPRTALQTELKTHKINSIAKEILNIAEKSLKELKTGEEKYLEDIKELTFNDLCPADIILRNWNGIWNQDIAKLIQYVKSSQSDI